jgi:hypothetical protein
MTNRKLLLGAVSLVKGRVKDVIPVGTELRDEIEPTLSPEFFQAVPFDRISLILRLGQGTDLTTEFQKIRHDELPIAIQLDMGELRHANRDQLKEKFREAVMAALEAVAARYPARPLFIDEGRTQLN